MLTRLEAYGWGNVNEAMHDAIKYAIDKGVPVVIATKVPNGRALPVYGFKGGGNTLQKAGAVFAGDLSGDKARILTMLALPTTKDQKGLQEFSTSNLRAEAERAGERQPSSLLSPAVS